jgi:uncharacterized protein
MATITIPASPPSRTWTLVTLLVASLVFGLVVVLFNAIGKVLLAGVVASGLRGRTTVEITTVMLGEIVVLALLVLYLRRRDVTLRQLGLWQWSPARGWLAAAVVAALFIWFNVALPLRNEQNLGEVSLFHLYNSLTAGVIAGVVEEIVFRGFFMTELAGAGFGKASQIAISGLLYGLIHSVWGVTSGMFTAQMLGSAVIGTGVFGACYATVYLASRRSLMPVILSHAAVDFVIEPWLFMVALTMIQAQ